MTHSKLKRITALVAVAMLGMLTAFAGGVTEMTDSALFASLLPDEPLEIRNFKVKVHLPKAKTKVSAATKMMPEVKPAVIKEPVTMKDVADSIHYAQSTPLDLPDINLTGEAEKPDNLALDQTHPVPKVKGQYAKGTQQSIYDMPYSLTGKCYDWKHLWINTGILAGAFVGTLFVLECLPEDATSWNRAELQNVPLFERWYDHVFRKGPEWDHDKFVFNYVLHPYAGAAYFMGARSCGFNFYQSLLYSSLISTVGWEFGVEAFMERPSYQDLFITPLVGSLIGEGCYLLKRKIVDNDYCLLGSKVLGNVVAFICDPLNEVVGYFGHGPARRVAREKAMRKKRCGESMTLTPTFNGLALRITF